MSDSNEWQLASPCVGICALSIDRVCIGCGRTNDEIAQWITMPKEARQTCLVTAKHRLEDMLNQQNRK